MSVVHFHCNRCGLEIVMGRKFWGKRVKCRQCGAVLIVPAAGDPNIAAIETIISEANPARNIPRTLKEVSDTPGSKLGKSGIIAITCGVLIVAGMLTWILFLRDTWEQDHHSELVDLIGRVDLQLTMGNIPYAIELFDGLNQKIGNHNIQGSRLAQALNDLLPRITAIRAEEERAKQDAANLKIQQEHAKQVALNEQLAKERRQRIDSELKADTAKNATVGDVHKILVPKGYLMGMYRDNMAWKKADESIYFDVVGSKYGQIGEEIRVLTVYKNNEMKWSAAHVKVAENNIYISYDGQEWFELP